MANLMVGVITAGLKGASGIGCAKIIGNACRTFMPATTHVAEKVCMEVAAIAIAGAVENAASKYIEETVNAGVEAVKGIKEIIVKSKKNKEEETVVEEVEVEVVE